ncbi:WecB/TagA/CpsF family glycosyltransferase [Actinomadura sp. ATCC 31491]|uniref:WecB/TagA/CpsF family glycosyltransferase n=1 Tax=Actinomadura luzonensis TaxID=2805427 RepID=A0ABT0FLL2_9ACTN|nr:WecB/TagA/CpsF family glycosyltransferase [Actinomadura luzonensis]MCK2213219.1 WecB/TagA/CpsF family glycosyltransferase [Actinomadura luzonensis]
MRGLVPGGGGPAGAVRQGRVRVGGVGFDAVREEEVVDRVADALAAGRGGRIVTPNVDICRLAATDPALRDLVTSADLVVADGMPLVWASRLLGTPLPARVTGADLLWSLSGLAARRGWPVYLLGGPLGAPQRAARALVRAFPGLRVCGAHAPSHGFDAGREGREAVRRKVVAARPRLVLVGLGFPRQDRLIADLRLDLPRAWFLGCGAAIAFAAGVVPRAPGWMRRAGLEWAYRLMAEPARLARRYLVDDLPFAARLLGRCLAARVLRSVSPVRVLRSASGRGPRRPG